ncbi:hypothetical protein ACDQ55_15140 [Chitinophaga sp. 30R24]|uniref:hypothetical protein n=1 Tax=Chitinophaga sp. 30R24 TaxID=3248838 RepID=UPI003B91FFC4
MSKQQNQTETTAASTLDAKSTILIVVDRQSTSQSFKESNHSFTCPTGTIMIGRHHSGDENGQTLYMYATLKAVDSSGNTVPGTFEVENSGWSSPQKESSSDFAAPRNQVITAREHQGDENGQTWYKTGQIYFNDRLCYIEPEGDDLKITVKESAGVWAKKDLPIIHRKHTGDENGNTTYYFGKIVS